MKSRIIEYTIDNYDAISNMVTESNKFNFTYDDSKVYLYYNEELMNTGVVGHNGFLDYLYEIQIQPAVSSITMLTVT